VKPTRRVYRRTQVGYLGCLFSWMHPIRHTRRRAQRALTPRPIRRILRTKNQVLHPVSSSERAVFRAVDRAVTPKHTRKRQTRSTAPAPAFEQQTREPARPALVEPRRRTVSGDQFALPPEAVLAPGRVPTTNYQVHQLLTERPPYWQFLLFAGLLLRGKEDLEPRWLDYERRTVQPTGRLVPAPEALAIASATVERIDTCQKTAVRNFNDAQAGGLFGASGAPPEPASIEYLANRTIAAYKELLDIAAKARQVTVPQELRNLLEMTAYMVDRPLRQIRNWIERTVREMDHIPELVARAGGQNIVLDLSLTLESNDRLIAQFGSEVDRLKSRR